MYDIGEKVVYPTHGAGVIDTIEERIVLGEKHSYYTMRIPVGDMKVMIPVDNAEATGLRKIISSDEAHKVIDFMAEFDCEENSNWNKRFRENSGKIKSGDIYSVASVVKILSCRNRVKGLSTGEKKMLTDATKILVSELVLSLDKTFEEVEEILEEKVFKNM